MIADKRRLDRETDSQPTGHIFSFVIGNKVVIGNSVPYAIPKMSSYHSPVLIVLNTAQVAWDLLEKRGEIYSSRPRSIMGYVPVRPHVRTIDYLSQICGFDCRHEILSRKMWGLGMAYNDKWRKWRKVRLTATMQRCSLTLDRQLQHSCLNTKYAVNYQTFQMLESSILLRDLLDDPAKYSTHFTRQESVFRPYVHP